MTIRVAINGFGRMGRLALRSAWGHAPYEIVAINETAADAALSAHLLQFDSVQGRWDRTAHGEGDRITIDGAEIRYSSAPTPAEMDLDGIDMVLECTGVFKSVAKTAPYFDGGVKKVVVSAPVKEDGALNIVMGVNDHLYDPHTHDLVTAASCTTNCLAPVVKVVHESFGIRHGAITTIHDVTNTQTIIDKGHKDWRRARSALTNLVPTSTGSATAIGLIFPDLVGKLNGIAVRVPLLNASITDCVFELGRPVTVEEINAALRAAAEGPLKGIMAYEDRPLVSSDYVGDPHSATVDGLSTMVVNGTQVKIIAWYDNEWGYANRLAELGSLVAKGLA